MRTLIMLSGVALAVVLAGCGGSKTRSTSSSRAAGASGAQRARQAYDQFVVVKATGTVQSFSRKPRRAGEVRFTAVNHRSTSVRVVASSGGMRHHRVLKGRRSVSYVWKEPSTPRRVHFSVRVPGGTGVIAYSDIR